MFKKFFAKLTGVTNQENRFQPSADRIQINKARQEHEANLARERQEAHLRNMPEGERLRRQSEELRSITEKEKHDQAA